MAPRLAPFLLPLLLLLAPPTLARPDGAPADWSTRVACDGSLPREATFADPAAPLLHVQVDAFCADEAPAADAALDGLTDCARTTYARTGHKWFVPYAARVDPANPSGLPEAGVLAAFQAALDTWDDATSAEIAGAMGLGGAGADAGVLDGVNQAGWKPLSSGVIAVTITWFTPTAVRVAVESDAAYNAGYAWSLTGAGGKYDLQGIAAHELGHTFGLADLYDGADACLTMYGYGSTGDTSKRTLGDGDLLGLRSLYGA